MKTQPKPAEIEAEEVDPQEKPVSKRGQNLKAFQFKKGVSGNPGGKPVGARNLLSGDFLRCLSADFAKHGTRVISRARNKDPIGYIKVIAGLLPKQLEKVAPLDELNDAQLAAAIDLLRSHQSISQQPHASGFVAKTGKGASEEGDITTIN